MFHGAFTDEESSSNFFVAFATGQIRQNLSFSVRQFRMGHRFSKFKSDLRRKEALSFSDSTYSFPDLLRMCRFDQESFGSGLEGLPNVCFGLVNSHDDNPWFGTSPLHYFGNN